MLTTGLLMQTCGASMRTVGAPMRTTGLPRLICGASISILALLLAQPHQHVSDNVLKGTLLQHHMLMPRTRR